jgi:hypothetical protein
MRELLASCILAIASLVPMPLAAGHPDFSGTWVAVPSQVPPKVDYSSGGYRMFSNPEPASFSAKFIARQDGDVLTVERKLRDSSLVTTYRLDGTESENVEVMKSVSVAKWEGESLLITTWDPSKPRNEKPLKRALSLAPDGSLVIVTENGGPKWTTVYRRE